MFGNRAQSASKGVHHIIATTSTLVSVSILITSAYLYGSYHRQQNNDYNEWWLPLWPQHFDTRGTRTAIGVAAGLVLLKFIFFAGSIIPRVRFKSIL
jgi:hypothetical protein